MLQKKDVCLSLSQSDEIARMCKMGVSDFAISKISLMPRYFVMGARDSRSDPFA